MKKILIATRNKDKFKIIEKLLSTQNFTDYKYYSLDDIDESIVDKKERGSVIERSYQKALNAFNCINSKYDYIVGVDDGIKMKRKIIENVKDYISLIIDDKFLKEGEVVYIVRAYTFINSDGIYKSVLTEIPFKYTKLKEKINIHENSYPLSNVLTPIDSLKTVIKLSADESNTYYLKYSKSSFDEVEEFFNNN